MIHGGPNHGSEFSHWTVRVERAGELQSENAIHRRNCRSAGAFKTSDFGVVERATGHTVSTRRLDRSSGGASRPRKPHEQLYSLQTRLDRRSTHDQTVRRSPLGAIAG